MSGKSDVTMEVMDTPEAKSLNPNDVDTKESKSKKPTLNYLLELLSDSVVTGVPQIITVSSLLRKIFKILVLGACIGGFIYQAVEFMKLYKTYPSSLEIEMDYTDDLSHPAVTVCNNNPVKRTEYCNAKKEFCSKPTNRTRFCNMYPQYCSENTTLDDLKFVVSDRFIETADVEAYGHGNEIIEECCVAFFPARNQCRAVSKKRVRADEYSVEKNCYTIDFSKVDFLTPHGSIDAGVEAGKKSCLLWSKMATDDYYLVLLNLDPNELTRPDRKPSAQVLVHSPNDEKDPFQKGFTVEEGKRYTVTMKAFEEHLLPDPYSTNCTEKEKLGDNYDREECILLCFVKRFIMQCGCLPEWMNIGEGIRSCGTLEGTLCLKTVIEQGNCYGECPRRCHFSYFEYKVSSFSFEDNVKPIDLGDGPIHIDRKSMDKDTALELEARERWSSFSKGRALLKIAYSSKETTVFKYKPKYEKIEILGYIGGFSGIWLGVSLVAVFDFFETIIVFTVHMIKSAKAKKERGRR